MVQRIRNQSRDTREEQRNNNASRQRFNDPWFGKNLRLGDPTNDDRDRKNTEKTEKEEQYLPLWLTSWTMPTDICMFTLLFATLAATNSEFCFHTLCISFHLLLLPLIFRSFLSYAHFARVCVCTFLCFHFLMLKYVLFQHCYLNVTCFGIPRVLFAHSVESLHLLSHRFVLNPDCSHSTVHSQWHFSSQFQSVAVCVIRYTRQLSFRNCL